jgi:cobyrinic acid a,c-diamide synthase
LKTLVIAGVQSGCGKTTVATGVMAALAARTQVQPFKVGPDYIDPSYHTRVCGRPSRNLDTWMVRPAAVLELFERASRDADIAVIEGVMGLYDGRTGGGEAGSTAEVAKLLRSPLVLVLDASHMARSAAAVVAGFRAFDPGVRIAGVILNRIASPRHYEAVAGPIEREAGVRVLGALPRDDRLALPERYLGLVPTVEGPVAEGYFDFLRDTCRRSIDLDGLERIAAETVGVRAGSGTIAPSLFPQRSVEPEVRIAVARDRAFSFYYEDNLDLLRAWGAEIVPFSPLADSGLPDGTAAVYLGGGFPELFAADLAANRSMLLALRAAATAGMPVYGECGGLMYLGEGLTDADGRAHTMAGVVPARSSMSGARLTLGYRELRALQPSPLLEPGSAVRGHEFHWSRLAETPDPEHAAYAVDGDGRLEGYCSGPVLASYMHLHFAASAAIAPRFVDACCRWQQARAGADAAAIRGRRRGPAPRSRAQSGPD